jgi:hypothetical protein
MDVHIVSICIQIAIENKRSVHEGARVYQASMFTHTHFLNIKHIATIENLKHDGTLASKNHDFLIGYLVR